MLTGPRLRARPAASHSNKNLQNRQPVKNAVDILFDTDTWIYWASEVAAPDCLSWQLVVEFLFQLSIEGPQSAFFGE